MKWKQGQQGAVPLFVGGFSLANKGAITPVVIVRGVSGQPLLAAGTRFMGVGR